MADLRIGISQLNPVMGDIDANVRSILEACRSARRQGVRLLVTPEFSVCGYPPDDLVYYDDFLLACRRGVEKIARLLPPGLVALVGTAWRDGGRTYNAACVLARGSVEHVYFKCRLPNYGVFDEKRYFSPGLEPCAWDMDSFRIGVLICEDLQDSGRAMQRLADEKPDVTVVLNASPYYVGKESSRFHWGVGAAGRLDSYLVYVNMVGGQDEHVYDGSSFVVDPHCRIVKVLPSFEETLEAVALSFDSEMEDVALPAEEELVRLRKALVLGLRDYVDKSGFKGALLGVSGGIDSAVVLALAVEALGSDRVVGVMMPSRHTSGMSVEDAEALAKALGVRLLKLPIEGVHSSMVETLADAFAGAGEDVTEENIQARIRGGLLMALSNKWGHIVLATGNKSELACGYCTLYGDMAGGFAVLKDVVKRTVYRLAESYNAQAEMIPRRILERAPSAELRPGQTDQDTLPPYDLIDDVVEAYMERMEDAAKIMRRHGARSREVLDMIGRNEYKRRQAPPGITVTRRAFGKDWRMPICHRWRPSA